MRRLRIGRSETNEIVIPDASVSRQHAEAVEIGDGRFALSDLGSTFGTQVWVGQNWIAAKDTPIDVDTVIRFGEFRTTLRDVLSEPDRMALGLSRAQPPQPVAEPAPPPAQPTAAAAEAEAPAVAAATTAPPARTAAPEMPPAAPPPVPRPTAPVSRSAERPSTTRDARAAARTNRSGVSGKGRAMMLGLLATGGFFVVAAGIVAVALTFGDPNGAGPRPEPRSAATEGQQRFLEVCTTNWGIEERRCRCFLAAAGPNLEAADYDDFATLVQGHISGDPTEMESVLQQAGEKRGTAASARLSAAMKGVVRDCAEQ